VQNAEIKKIVIHSKAADFEEMWISIRFLRIAAFLSAKSGRNHLVSTASGSSGQSFLQDPAWK
jgi:hypothetical protein